MRLERFTDKAQEAFQEAQEIMHEQHHTQLDVEHIFLAMLRQKAGSPALARTLSAATPTYGLHPHATDCWNAKTSSRSTFPSWLVSAGGAVSRYALVKSEPSAPPMAPFVSVSATVAQASSLVT